jgi:hypothetical protein
MPRLVRPALVLVAGAVLPSIATGQTTATNPSSDSGSYGDGSSGLTLTTEGRPDEAD